MMRINKMNGLLVATAAMMPALVAAQEAQRPNIMLILVDDMGYSDLQCFGGEVQSPSLNSLAEDGSRFTQFFNCGRSCPSRASLMTGCYPHEVGITGMGLDLSTNCVTVAEALKSAGYHTGMSGKWHLSRTTDMGNPNQMIWQSHQGFFDRDFANRATYPCNRGFDEHWGTIWGVSDHFDPFSLVHNEEPIFTDGIPEGFYYSDFVADKAIDMLQGYAQDNKPFFMYVAFQEPHWPVQAKPEDIAKYDGVYDEGWDVIRDRRYNKMVELGIVDPAQTPNAPNMSNRPWANESRKQWQADNMEVHAAMVDCVDQNIGRIIAYLKANGMYDNTLIVFSSDNGASSENYGNGAFDRHDMTRDGQKVVPDAPVPGSQLTYNYIHDGWAGAVNAPFRYWKRQSFHGGVAAPTIIKWPESMGAPKNNIVNEPCNFIDFMPTCLELSGATYPTTYNGHIIQPIAEEARSLVPMAQADAKWDTERIMFWEHENGKAVRTNDWRLTKHTDGTWQLFDMHTDYSETKDVSAQHPDVVKRLKKLWAQWAKSVGLSAPLTIEAGKTYTIANRNDNNLFVQDNGTNVLQMGAFNNNSYWEFEPTGEEDVYYVKNAKTGRYAQMCATSAEVNITMGDEPVAYKVLSCDSEGNDCFGLTSTNQSNTNFTTGCIGWNWKGDNTVQTFAAAEGTNHRSFWKLTEKMYVDDTNHWPLDGKIFTIENWSTGNPYAYMQDNSWSDDRIECKSTVDKGVSYWTFEKTGNHNCYYVKNAFSGRYIQGYSKTEQQMVKMGNEPVEFFVQSFDNRNGAFCLVYTGNEPHDCQTTSTIGLNLKGETNEADCYVQTFKSAANTNGRSFWYLAESDFVHDHNYVNGVCTFECCQDKFEAPTLNAGVYELRNAGNIEWFGAKVADGDLTINGTLMNDIDFTGVEHTPIGPSTGRKYNGTFDGQGHRIMNLVINRPEEDNQAFFNYLRGNNQNTIIRNLIIDKSCSITGRNNVAAFAADGQNNETIIRIENCVNEASVTGNDNVAAFVASSTGNDPNWYILNCVNAGNITGHAWTGAVSGWFGSNGNAKIENFLNVGTVVDQTNYAPVHNLSRIQTAANMINCIDAANIAGDLQGQHDWATDDPIVSGEAAYVAGATIFKQRIGTDAYPSPLGEAEVKYVGDMGYATYCQAESFSPNGNGVSASIITGADANNVLALQTVNVVPSGEGVLLSGTYYNALPSTEEPDDCSENKLVGVLERTRVPEGAYVLRRQNDVIAFYRVNYSAYESYANAGKAYLSLGGTNISALYFDEETDIHTFPETTGNKQQTAELYNLAGQRISKSQRGVNIVDGKKVVIK